MGRGRRPAPTALKLAHGVTRRDRINQNEPQPERGIPPAPESLSEEARKAWAQIAPQLDACGVLTQLDATALELLASAYARWVEADAKVRETGLIVKAPSGFPVQNPYLAVANRAADQLSKLLIEFGMTPASRTKVTAGMGAGPKPKDDLAAFVASRGA